MSARLARGICFIALLFTADITCFGQTALPTEALLLDDPVVRLRAVQHLAQNGTEAHRDAIPMLLNILKSNQSDGLQDYFVENALTALMRIDAHDPRVANTLLEMEPLSGRRSHLHYLAAIARIGPDDPRTIPIFVNLVRRSPVEFEARLIYTGPSFTEPFTAERFFRKINPDHARAASQFVDLLVELPDEPGVASVCSRVFVDMNVVENLPPKIIKILLPHLRQGNRDAIKLFESMGAPAAVAMPILIEMLDNPRDFETFGGALRILQQLDPGEAPTALPVLKALIPSLQKSSPHHLINVCRTVLHMDPQSDLALDSLEMLLEKLKRHPQQQAFQWDIIQIRGLLARHERNRQLHLRSLQNYLINSDKDPRAAASAANELLRLETPSDLRRMTVEFILHLQSHSNSDPWVAEVSARGLLQLNPPDSQGEGELIHLVRDLWTAEDAALRQREWDIGFEYGYGHRLKTLVKVLAKTPNKSAEIIRLLDEIGSTTDYDLRNAAQY